MTATEIRNLAGRLSNASWCRYWLNVGERNHGVLMAIQCRGADGSPEPIRDIERIGFKEDNLASSSCFYIIARTNDDGTPYIPKLF